ncbi:MAG: SpoIIIAH-like family protein [Bacillota bacterium]|nr:SpoIIIAH-like family protein [Bacillota bacterium]
MQLKKSEIWRWVAFLFLFLLALYYVVHGQVWQRWAREIRGSLQVSVPSDPDVTWPEEILVREEAPSGEMPVLGTPGGWSQDYFGDARRERNRAWQEAATLLQAMVDDPQVTAEGRRQAEAKLLQLVRERERAPQLEALLKAKGYDDALVLFGEGSATVVLKTQGISREDVARVLDAAQQVLEIPVEAIHILARPGS